MNRVVRHPLRAACAAACLAAASGAAVAAAPLYSALLHRGAPPVGERMIVVYERLLFAKGAVPGARVPTDAGIDAAAANAAAQRRAAEERGQGVAPVVALVVERWPTWPFVPLEQHLASVADYADVARRFASASGEKVCLNGVFPGGGISTVTRSLREEPLREEWEAVARASWEVLDGAVDALCPSLYTYYDGEGEQREFQISQWQGFARRTLEVGRDIAPELPIYPFVWPRFHGGGGLAGEPFVPPEYWRAELETLADAADGVVLWGGYDPDARAQRPWDESAPWWEITRDVFGDQLASE